MDHIDEGELRKVPTNIVVKPKSSITYDEDSIRDLHTIMNSPLEVQKEEAAILYNYLFQKRKQEIEEKGVISDHTRRIMEGYHTLLDNIQKNMHGTKSMNLHMHGGLTPNHIAAYIQTHKRDKKEVVVDVTEKSEKADK